MSEEEKNAIDFYNNCSGEVEFEIENFDMESFKKAIGITEETEEEFENHRIRIKTLLNLIEKQNNKINYAINYIKEKQKIQYKYGLSHIECGDLLLILKGVNYDK